MDGGVAGTVHCEAHRLEGDEIYEVSEGSLHFRPEAFPIAR